MKLHVEYKGRVCDYETHSMREGRFRALCKLAAAGIYAGMVVAITSICSFSGLVVMAVVTLLFGAGYLMKN